MSPGRAIELGGAQLARDLIENGVDHASLILVDEGMSNVDILGDDDTRRNILLLVEFVSPGPQHCAQNRLHALERPSRGERLIDERVETALFGDDTANEFAKE